MTMSKVNKKILDVYSNFTEESPEFVSRKDEEEALYFLDSYNQLNSEEQFFE